MTKNVNSLHVKFHSFLLFYSPSASVLVRMSFVLWIFVLLELSPSDISALVQVTLQTTDWNKCLVNTWSQKVWTPLQQSCLIPFVQETQIDSKNACIQKGFTSQEQNVSYTCIKRWVSCYIPHRKTLPSPHYQDTCTLRWAKQLQLFHITIASGSVLLSHQV